ncbi:hypothetical protein D918_06922 [Trichuris suis]|nr:hypothetical protein D918_06922 [Trichuris suis]
MDTTAQTFDIMIHELSKGAVKDLKGTVYSNGSQPVTLPTDGLSSHSDPARVILQPHSHSFSSSRQGYRLDITDSNLKIEADLSGTIPYTLSLYVQIASVKTEQTVQGSPFRTFSLKRAISIDTGDETRSLLKISEEACPYLKRLVTVNRLKLYLHNENVGEFWLERCLSRPLSISPSRTRKQERILSRYLFAFVVSYPKHRGKKDDRFQKIRRISAIMKSVKETTKRRRDLAITVNCGKIVWRCKYWCWKKRTPSCEHKLIVYVRLTFENDAASLITSFGDYAIDG